MADRGANDMRDYWDARARENAVWYVDTSTDYDEPDMQSFLAAGEEIVRFALHDAPVQPTGRELAVEIGSGLGRICRALSAEFTRVVGLDISAEMVRRAGELVEADNVEFAVGDGTSLAPIADASADLVLTFTVFQHLPSAELIADYLREAARVLRPGGVLAAQWNNQPRVPFRLRAGWWRMQRCLGRAGEHQERLAPQFVGTPVAADFIRDTLTAAGLEVHTIRGEGTLYAWVWAVKPA